MYSKYLCQVYQTHFNIIHDHALKVASTYKREKQSFNANQSLEARQSHPRQFSWPRHTLFRLDTVLRYIYNGPQQAGGSPERSVPTVAMSPF
jgi:hypothetical protein